MKLPQKPESAPVHAWPLVQGSAGFLRKAEYSEPIDRGFDGLFVAMRQGLKWLVTTDGKRMHMVRIGPAKDIKVGRYRVLSWKTSEGSGIVVRGPIDDPGKYLEDDSLFKPIPLLKDMVEIVGLPKMRTQHKKNSSYFGRFMGIITVATGLGWDPWFVGDAYHPHMEKAHYNHDERILRISTKDGDHRAYIKSLELNWPD